MSNNIIKILIAEDHHTVREGLKMIINSQEDMMVIGEAEDGYEAIRLSQIHNPDLIIMDISMPELNGLRTTEKLKKISSDIKILTLTRHTDEAYLQELIRAGVDGYVLKQSLSRELLHAIRTVSSGGKYLDMQVTKKVLSLYGDQITKIRGDNRGNLTFREAEVLRHIALGYSNREISEKLNISIKTVEAHKSNSLKKLDMTSRREIMNYAILQGWMRET